MTLDPRTPVIIGVGQRLQREDNPLNALAPAPFMAEAVRAAVADAGLSSTPTPDSLVVVSFLSWKYANPATAVSHELGIEPGETVGTTMGGNTPQSLVNQTALDILNGRSELVILTGGETQRTKNRAKKAGIDLPWTDSSAGAAPARVFGEELDMVHPVELARRIYMPIQVYPLFETAIRAASGRSVDEHRAHLGKLWSGFSKVAADNEYAWSRTPLTPEQITTPSPTNRMIGLPYTKVMNSNNDVDMSAAVIMCSVAMAERLGVSRDKWVFPHAGTDCHEHNFVSNRWTFADTPAIELGGRMVLEMAGCSIDDIDIIDLYSCFPSAVQAGARSLGLSLDRQLTRTGGLPFGGGPWNNYVMHAIATVVNDVRSRPGEKGLVWANGGYTTKHAFGVYSTEPPVGGFKHAYPQDRIDALPKREVLEPSEAAGAATVEAYTVMHDRDGEPELAIATCLTASGARAWGMSNDRDTARALCEGEWVGRAVRLDNEGTLLI